MKIETKKDKAIQKLALQLESTTKALNRLMEIVDTLWEKMMKLEKMTQSATDENKHGEKNPSAEEILDEWFNGETDK